MANHKSAEKRIRQAPKRAARNAMIRKTMRTFIKRVRAAVESKDGETAKVALAEAIRKIDKAATKGVIHKNQASRRVSRLTKLVAKEFAG